MRNYYIFTGVLVVLSLILAALAVENPFLVKDRKQDATILSTFSSISSQINSYYIKNKKLPETLEDINSTYKNNSYDYATKTATSYQLCATFLTEYIASPTPDNPMYYDYEYDYGYGTKPHARGYDCIEFKLSSYTIQSANPTVTPTFTPTVTKATTTSGPTDLAIIDSLVNDSTVSIGKNLIYIPIIKNLGTNKATFNINYYLNGTYSSGGNGYTLNGGEILDPRISSKGFSYPYQKDIVGDTTQLKITIDFPQDSDISNNTSSYTFTNSKTATTPITCSSPNGNGEGVDYNKKGSITSSNKTYTDYCLDNTLMEFACSSNTMRLFSYKCINGCQNGQCI